MKSGFLVCCVYVCIYAVCLASALTNELILFILGIQELIHSRSVPSEYEPSIYWALEYKMVISSKTAVMS
jgi:hypothetical protein